MLTEYVLSKEEFEQLTRGRVHFAIERVPVKITNMAGNGVMDSGEVQIYIKITALSKDSDPTRIICMKENGGVVHQYDKEQYNDRIDLLRNAAKEEFPSSTEGGFE